MRKLLTLLLLAPLFLLAGTIKKGTNSYRVTADIASGNMQSTFAPLGSTTVTLYKSANNAASSPLTYRSTSQFNSLTSLAIGDIVTITNNGSEVNVTGLGEANIATGGVAGPLVNITTTVGQTVLTIPNKQVSDITAVYRKELLTPTIHYTLSQSGSNVLVTLASGVQPVTDIEASTPTSFQYQ